MCPWRDYLIAGGNWGIMSEVTRAPKTEGRIIIESEYLNREANELVYAGKPDEALELFNRVTELDPTHATAWHNKGTCLDELGMQGDAIRCYDKALAIDPYNAESWFNKGICLKKIGKVQEADTCIEHAVKLAMGLDEHIR